MPDTQRSTDALLTLFADNTSGAITAQDARDLVVSSVVYRGAYSGTETYYPGNQVYASGTLYQYVSDTPASGTNPATGGAGWVALSGGSSGSGTPSGSVLGAAVVKVVGGTITSTHVSGVVASISRVSTGLFTVTFTGSQSNYTVAAFTADNNAAPTYAYASGTDTALGSASFNLYTYSSATGAPYDSPVWTVTIFQA